jgi:uncharacterized protein (DUF1684 family)
VLLLLALLTLTTPSVPAPDHRADVEKWRADRLVRLTAEDGWLTLVGLSWLNEGENSVGAAAGSQVVFPTGRSPLRLGRIRVSGEKAHLDVAPGVDVTHDGKKVRSIDLASDEKGAPTVLRHGTLTFYLIRRGDRLGVRVKDTAAPTRKGFHGIDNYPISSEWRLDARFEPHAAGQTIAVPNILGSVTNEPSPGAFVFRIGGREYRLDAIEEEGESELFVIFGDRTNGTTTYGAGRFLYASRPGADGHTVVDFNKAYNPPCAFTPFATCPLPPTRNRLPIPIAAGEKSYKGSGH